jgi:hypothetical protein
VKVADKSVVIAQKLNYNGRQFEIDRRERRSNKNRQPSSGASDRDRGNAVGAFTVTGAEPAPVITYATPQTYVMGAEIEALVVQSTGGSVTSYVDVDGLPAGLELWARHWNCWAAMKR